MEGCICWEKKSNLAKQESVKNYSPILLIHVGACVRQELKLGYLER